MAKLSDSIFGVSRVVIGLLFACHGAQKLFGLLGGHRELNDPLGLAAGVIEFFGGVLVVLGLATRPAAFIMSGEMAVAYFKAQALYGFWPILNHGELAVVYCFIFLYMAAHGAGSLSLDAAIQGGSKWK